jgi:hypothetical protein
MREFNKFFIHFYTGTYGGNRSQEVNKIRIKCAGPGSIGGR